jgi:hypothetical protein
MPPRLRACLKLSYKESFFVYPLGSFARAWAIITPILSLTTTTKEMPPLVGLKVGKRIYEWAFSAPAVIVFFE